MASAMTPTASSEGFGLAGMRERVELAGGRLSVDSGEQGTLHKSKHLPTLRGSRAALTSASRPRRNA